jgi:hypothetical protein
MPGGSIRDFLTAHQRGSSLAIWLSLCPTLSACSCRPLVYGMLRGRACEPVGNGHVTRIGNVIPT